MMRTILFVWFLWWEFFDTETCCLRVTTRYFEKILMVLKNCDNFERNQMKRWILFMLGLNLLQQKLFFIYTTFMYSWYNDIHKFSFHFHIGQICVKIVELLIEIRRDESFSSKSKTMFNLIYLSGENKNSLTQKLYNIPSLYTYIVTS